MVTNAKESYEAKILEKLIDNSEKLAVIGAEFAQVKVDIRSLNTEVNVLNSRMSGLEEKIDKINSKQNWFFTILAGIGTGILATLYSHPILTALSNLK